MKMLAVLLVSFSLPVFAADVCKIQKNGYSRNNLERVISICTNETDNDELSYLSSNITTDIAERNLAKANIELTKRLVEKGYRPIDGIFVRN